VKTALVSRFSKSEPGVPIDVKDLPRSIVQQ
jgi:hypothetical protein